MGALHDRVKTRHDPKPKPKLKQKGKPAKKPPKFRLPDGSLFNAIYNATGERWDVTLTCGEFSAEYHSASVHDALRRLGQLWFKWHKGQKRQGAECTSSAS